MAVTQPSATYDEHSTSVPDAFARPRLAGWRAPVVPYEISDAVMAPVEATPAPAAAPACPAPLPGVDKAELGGEAAWPPPANGALPLDRLEPPPPGTTRLVELSDETPDLPEPVRRATRTSNLRFSVPSSGLGERRRSLPPAQSFGNAHGDAIELVTVRATSSVPPEEVVDMSRARDRFEVGDFTGALTLAEAVLEADPANADAILLAEHCRDVLKQMILSRLGGLGRVPQLAMAREQLRWLSLDHRTGFVLSLVDGHSTVDELLDMSGMNDLDALRILVDLVQQKVIAVSGGAGSDAAPSKG